MQRASIVFIKSSPSSGAISPNETTTTILVPPGMSGTSSL
jgi:hypothetical protein